jgi:hypothetical protein
MKTEGKAKAGKKKKAKKDIAASYNAFKEFEGKQYTGMQIGRSHAWYYDKGEWKETKVSPEKWEIEYKVVKRRKGKAPEGSGVPVGTEYHWYILAHQTAVKLDANSYDTNMTGLKFKLAHKRADHDKWNISEATQRKHLIGILQEFIAELEKKPMEMKEETAEKEIAESEKSRAPAKRKRKAVALKRTYTRTEKLPPRRRNKVTTAATK